MRPLQEQKAEVDLRVAQMAEGYYSAEKALKLAQLEETTALTNLRRDALAQANKANESTRSLIDTAYKSFGAAGTSSVEDISKMDPKQRQALVTLGFNLDKFGTTGLPWAPGETIELLKEARIPYHNGPTGHLPTAEIVDREYQNAVAKALQVKPGEKVPSGEALKTQVNSNMVQTFVEQQARGWAPNNGLFSLPSVDTLIKQPWAQNNLIIQAMKPMTMDGAGNSISRPTDGSMIMSTVIEGIKSGKLTEDQAVNQLYDMLKEYRTTCRLLVVSSGLASQ